MGLQSFLAKLTSDNRLVVVPQTFTSGGATPYKLTSGASTNGTNVKASAGRLYGIVVNNQNAAVRYLKLYDKATAPTVGTDVPKHTIAVQGTSTLVVQLGEGVDFSSGIGLGLTTGNLDSDTGAVAANDLTVNLEYK